MLRDWSGLSWVSLHAEQRRPQLRIKSTGRDRLVAEGVIEFAITQPSGRARKGRVSGYESDRSQADMDGGRERPSEKVRWIVDGSVQV